MRRRDLPGWVLAGVVLAGCAGEPAPVAEPPKGELPLPQRYHPDRRDYASFAIAHPDLPEPNYLPFMLHRFARPGGLEDALIFCRWAPDQMPIRVWIEAPEIDPNVQDEFLPVDADAYPEAVEDALDIWEDALEGLVRFERVDDRRRAHLVVRLIGGMAPLFGEGRLRLGAAEKLADACRALGFDPEAERMQVRFDMPELVVHLADGAGLLPPTIVRRLVAHEIGHALGMYGHSPSPGDLMYAQLADAPGPEELSVQDVNSFLALYSLPNGAHFVDPIDGEGPERPPPIPPSGGPKVDRTPYVDVRHGFEISVPSSWVRVEEEHGAFFSDGPTWDHNASLRLFVWPSRTVEEFRACCTYELLAGTWLRHSAEMVVNGRRAVKLSVEDAAGQRARDLLFVELGDRRILLIVAESPVGYEASWRPWFDASLETLQIWEETGRRGLMPRP